MRTARVLLTTVLALLAMARPSSAAPLTAGRQLTSGAPLRCHTRVAPYMYGGWGNPQNPATVIRETGVRCFTIAFVLDRGHCRPGWETSGKTTRLTRGPDAALVRGIRASGGGVIPSSGGGADRTSLENTCSTARALARAYGAIVSTLAVHALDIDLEGDAEANSAVRAKVLRAVRLVHLRYPHLRISFTVPVDLRSLHAATVSLIRSAAATHTRVAVWSIMPFDDGGPRTRMAHHAIVSATRLHDLLHTLYPRASSTALYAREGLTEMNGRSDTRELTTVADFRRLARYAVRNRLGRFAYWAVNRDRPCSHRPVVPGTCSGTTAPAWAFTRAMAIAQ